LKPQSGRSTNNWAGLGVTLLDSLDTLWLMDMKAEFKEARDWVASSLSFNKPSTVSLFETTIRVLGGLNSAYDLSKDKIFLDKAVDLADRMLPAFDTTTGIPQNNVNLQSGAATNAGWTGSASVLSELGTLQVEFRYLTHATGNRVYADKAERAIDAVREKTNSNQGLYPIYINPSSGRASSSHITFGALGDSFYEYLLKMWIQGGKKETKWRQMYDASMTGMTNLLLQRTTPSNLAYVADYDGSRVIHKMDHLACFLPALLALGVHSDPTNPNAERDMKNAKAMTYTCYQMYARMPTGIAPEYVQFVQGRDFHPAPQARFYILRPETVEALFVLHQVTGDPIFREWGWRIFQSIEKYCKTTYGYGALPDVESKNRSPDDRMESFFLAETLKYLYLLQEPDHPIKLDKYVFNTEAHPTSVFEK
jgi:mannosyl-oligosaccharide alpha-1,2-mannosidase